MKLSLVVSVAVDSTGSVSRIRNLWCSRSIGTKRKTSGLLFSLRAQWNVLIGDRDLGI